MSLRGSGEVSALPGGSFDSGAGRRRERVRRCQGPGLGQGIAGFGKGRRERFADAAAGRERVGR